MRIEKLLRENHRRHRRIQDLPRELRDAVMQKRHELLSRWQQEGKPITGNTRACYGLASAIAVALITHPRDSDWGRSMFHKRGGLARMGQMTPEDLKTFTRSGALCSRTTRRTRKTKQKRELETELERRSGIGPDGLIPTTWYKQ